MILSTAEYGSLKLARPSVSQTALSACPYAAGDSRLLRRRPLDLAELARQIADLAPLGVGSVARGILTADVRVQMRAGVGAGAVDGHGLGVDVEVWAGG